MSYLFGIAVLSKALKKKTHKSRNSKNKKKTAYEIAKEDNERSLNREISFIEAIRFYIGYDKDEVLSSFFEDLHEYGKKIDDIDAKTFIERNNKYRAEVQEIEDTIKKKIDHELQVLGDINVYLVGRNGISFYQNPANSDETYTLSFSNELAIDGFIISLENLHNKKIPQLENEKQKYINLLSNYNEKDLREKLEKLEKRRFFTNKKKNADKIIEIKRKLAEIEDYKNKLTKIEKIQNNFSTLSSTQIEALKNIILYLNEYNKISQYEKEVCACYDMIAAIYGYNPHKKFKYGATFPTDNAKRKKWERALELMEKDGKFTPERISDIAIAIHNVITKLENNYYQKNIYMYSNYEYLKPSSKYYCAISEFFSLLESGSLQLNDINETINHSNKKMK